MYSAVQNTVRLSGGEDWCRAEGHSHAPASTEPCVMVDGFPVCRSCFLGMLPMEDEPGFPMLDFMLLEITGSPESCLNCPFHVPIEETCDLLGGELVDLKPICQWQQWRAEIESEISLL